MNKYAKKIYIVRRLGEIFYTFIKHLPDLKKSGPRYGRFVIADLGGGIIKLAQILAMRYDLLPARYCKEFANLFDRVPSVSPEEIKKIFQEEFGRNPEEIFQDFSYEPFASASFGQVYKARWSGHCVAIKVQKPEILERVRADIALMKFFVSILDSLWTNVPIDLPDAIREWEDWTTRELDYRIEARSAERLRNLNSDPNLYIPIVFPDLSTSRILVTEFLDGYSLNEVVRRDLALTFQDRERITRCLVWGWLGQYFKDGFFHADPHLGNIILLPDGRLGLVDFGIMGEAGTKKQNYHFAQFMKCASGGIPEKAAVHFRELMQSISTRLVSASDIPYRWRNKSPDKIEKGIIRFLEDELSSFIKQWAEGVGDPKKDLSQRSTARHFLSMISLARRFGLEIPMNLLAFIRATVIADMVCLQVDPNFSMKEALAFFFSHHPEFLSILPEAVQKPATVKIAISEVEIEKAREERDRFIERYIEYASRVMERILEEGSRGLAYFSTTKV